MSTNKRCRLSVSLGAQYEAFVSMCNKQDCKPSALASYILKSMVQEEVRISDDPQIKNLVTTAKSNSKHQHILLREDELAKLDRYAFIMGMTRHQAIIGIIRSVIADEPQFTTGEIEQLAKSNYELHKLGVNLNQIAHRTNTVDFSNFTDKNKEELKTLFNGLIERTDKFTKLVQDHSDKVWKLINASRIRTKLETK